MVFHDWLADRRSWDPVLPYLDGERFSYAFLDLRGYGGSCGITGTYTAAEAANDALEAATRLGWERFAAIGHSMSGLLVQQLAADAPSRITKLVAVTPVGPAGLAMPPERLAFMEGLAIDVPARTAAFRQSWGDRLLPITSFRGGVTS